MATKTISKRTDPAVQKIRDVRDGRNRSLVFCEGEKLLDELFGSDWTPVAVYATPAKIKVAERLRLKFGRASVPITALSDAVMEFCSDVSTPPGLIALAKSPLVSKTTSASEPAFHLILHGVQLPQNVGALIRSAEGAGVTHVFTTEQTADPFGPKALRGSSGSAFRVAISRGQTLTALVSNLRERGVAIVAATQDGSVVYDAFDWKKPVALAMGSEGSGFNTQELALLDRTVKIPMRGSVESLNVSIAAAICLFEAAKQRRSA